MVLVARDGSEIRSARCRFMVEVKEAAPPPPPEVAELNLEDFDFYQNGIKLLPVEGKLRVVGDEPVDIFIDYELFPENLKTIMITLKDGGRSFSFLMRVNEEKTFYRASSYPPREAGFYSATIHIFDYGNQTIRKIEFWLEVIERQIAPHPLFYRLILFFRRTEAKILLGVIVLLFVLFLFLIVKRRRDGDEDQDEEERKKDETSYPITFPR